MSEIYELANQFVVFNLDNQLYGIDIQSVQIIERVKSIMRVPKTQGWVKGVMNLRGEIIPVISLRMQFEMEDKPFDDSTRIVIVKIEESMVGLIVDLVKEVVEVKEEMIEVVQNIRGKMNVNHVQGVAKVDHEEGVVTLYLPVEDNATSQVGVATTGIIAVLEKYLVTEYGVGTAFTIT